MIAQLDLFRDTRDRVLVNTVIDALIERDRSRASAALDRLRAEYPTHGDLESLALLCCCLEAGTPPPSTHAGVTARIEEIERSLVPAARRLLGAGAAEFFPAIWAPLAAAATALSFDDAYPRAHRGWLCQQYGDWKTVRSATEREPGWTTRPLLRWWMGLACQHLGEPEAALRLWLPLYWLEPDLFARHAASLPSATLRSAWEAFGRVSADDAFDEDGDAVAWFPSWLLLRHRGIAALFQPEEVPGAAVPARVFRHLLALLPLERSGLSDELIRRRRELSGPAPPSSATTWRSWDSPGAEPRKRSRSGHLPPRDSRAGIIHERRLSRRTGPVAAGCPRAPAPSPTRPNRRSVERRAGLGGPTPPVAWGQPAAPPVRPLRPRS